MSDRGGRHVHIYYSPWLHESRAWRAGRAAIESGRAARVDYIGYRSEGRPDMEPRGPSESILRVGAAPAAAGSSRLRRAAALPRWWVAASKAALRGQKPELVVAHSLASLPLGVALKLVSGARLLYDAHELESEREGWARAVRFGAAALEAVLIRFCDHTVVVNGSIARWYRNRYKGLDVSVVRNVPVTLGSRGASTLRADIGAGETDLVVVYLGAFTKGRGLTIGVEAFRRLGADKRLVLVGYGPLREALIEAAAGASNIHILDPVSHDQVVSFISGADVGISQADGTSLSYHYGLPNKLFEYAAARLAVILSRGPEKLAFLEESKLGWGIEATADALEDLVRGLTRQAAIAKAAEAVDYTPPTWASEKQFFLDTLDRALGRGGADQPAVSAELAATGAHQ